MSNTNLIDAVRPFLDDACDQLRALRNVDFTCHFSHILGAHWNLHVDLLPTEGHAEINRALTLIVDTDHQGKFRTQVTFPSFYALGEQRRLFVEALVILQGAALKLDQTFSETRFGS